MSEAVVRQRSLMPLDSSAGIEGWMDDDVASAATQLFGGGQAGVLVIDARELLTSTARVVGAQLGELHFKVWMAIVTLHVAHGLPEDGRGEATIAELSRMIWGDDRERGGSNTKKLLRALTDLRESRFAVPGYDVIRERFADGVSDTSLLINLWIDSAMLKAFEAPDSAVDRVAMGRALGGKQRGTIGWRLHPDYTTRLAESDLRRFDWDKAQRLRGAALNLWMVFTSPRVPFRAIVGQPTFEQVEIPLTVEHCHALGVRAAADAARRRTLNQAGERVCAADRSFVAFEAHGGRGRHSFVRIIRRRPDPGAELPVVVPAEQLSLIA